MPVLPLVASMRVAPGLSLPCSSASEIMLTAGLQAVYSVCKQGCAVLFGKEKVLQAMKKTNFDGENLAVSSAPVLD